MYIVPKKLFLKYELNKTQDKKVIQVSLWLPWKPIYQVCGWCLSQAYFVPNMISIGIKTWHLLRYYCNCHGNLVTTAVTYVAGGYCSKKALQRK